VEHTSVSFRSHTCICNSKNVPTNQLLGICRKPYIRFILTSISCATTLNNECDFVVIFSVLNCVIMLNVVTSY
jgi:hypothetical protein